MWKSRGFTLSSSWVSKLRTLFLRLSSAALWRKSPFRYLCPRPRSCGHYPELMSIGEGQSTDQVVNRELCLPSSVNLPRHASLTCEQDPYVHAWGWTYLPNGSGLRTKAKMYLLYWSLIYLFFLKKNDFIWIHIVEDYVSTFLSNFTASTWLSWLCLSIVSTHRSAFTLNTELVRMEEDWEDSVKL